MPKLVFFHFSVVWIQVFSLCLCIKQKSPITESVVDLKQVGVLPNHAVMASMNASSGIECTKACTRLGKHCQSLFYNRKLALCLTMFRNSIGIAGYVTDSGTKHYEVRGYIGAKCGPRGSCHGKNTVCRNNICNCLNGYVFSLVTNFCQPEKAIGWNCSASWECIGDTSRCYQGECVCGPGESFFQPNGKCYQRCVTFADTFSYTSNCYIANNNIDTLSFSTDAGCLAACLNTSGCLSVDVADSSDHCFTSRVTRFQVSSKDWLCGTSWSHYVRNCATV